MTGEQISQKGYFGQNKQVPVLIKVTDLSEQMVSIKNQDQIIYDGTTDWLQYIIDNGWIEVEGYVQDEDYTVRKANPNQQAVAQGTYARSLVVERKDGGQLQGGPM